MLVMKSGRNIFFEINIHVRVTDFQFVINLCCIWKKKETVKEKSHDWLIRKKKILIPRITGNKSCTMSSIKSLLILKKQSDNYVTLLDTHTRTSTHLSKHSRISFFILWFSLVDFYIKGDIFTYSFLSKYKLITYCS